LLDEHIRDFAMRDGQFPLLMRALARSGELEKLPVIQERFGKFALVAENIAETFCAFDRLSEIRLTALERMAGTTRLELATSAATGSEKWFYNNLQRRGDCQTQRKSCKTIQIVGWVVG
jgi:hypothetical protein